MDKCFICFKSHVSLIKCSPNHFIFFRTLIYSTKKEPYVPNSQKIKYISTFRFWYSNILKHYYNFEFVIMVQSKVIDLTIIQGLMQKKLRTFHVICHIWLQIWYYVRKTLWKMRYKPIENCHMEDAVLRKDFNLDTIGSLFHAFTHVPFLVHLSAHSPSPS